MISFAYVSPRKVLRASSRAVQWQFWVTVGVCMSVASVPLMARTDQMTVSDWLQPAVIIALVGGIVGAAMAVGVTRAQLSQVRESFVEVPKLYVRKDVLEKQIETLLNEMRYLNERLDRH